MTIPTNDDRIRTLWASMAEHWAKGDAGRFAANFAEDCDFTTVRGDKPSGRVGIAAGHEALFRTVYRGSTLVARVRDIRYLRDDIATVNAESEITGADGTVLARTHALAVVELDAGAGQWSITAFHNMVPLSTTDTPGA
ncbi:SgcJ/EcaC family oxidoreductase [Streptomyces sp. NPDC005408]|uniref:SgcJ/EcaC family oxidoreductase n=1 Tax=Streptomyces sp. NPDC005408 TaxID=3155341 RepID=UPI0033BD5D5A